MNRRNLAISSIVVSLLLSASSFAADNRQNFNGSYCDNYYGSQTTSFNHQYNGIANISTSGLYVSCPLVADEINNTTGTNFVWVHYTGAGTASCTLFSMNGTGTSIASTFGSGNGWFSVPALASDDIWGSYSMYCYLPAGGVLNTIALSEKG